MKNVTKLLLASLCLSYGFIAQASMPKYGHGKVDIDAYQKSLSSWDDFKEKLSYRDRDELHKHITDEYRKRGTFTFVDAFSPGQSAQVDYKGKKDITVHKPTLDEREIIVNVLKSRKHLPATPEKIADLIYIVDSKIDNGGFHHSKYDRIFIPSYLLSNPSKLLHVILHEYTHYMYVLGHKISGAEGITVDIGGVEQELPYNAKAEESRADNYATEIVDCAGCSGEYASTFFPKDVPVNQRNRVAKDLAKRTGYTAPDLYTDPDALFRMSRKFCSNCLQSRQMKLSNPTEKASSLNLEKSRIATEKRIEVSKIRADYYASKKNRDYISDEFLY